VIPIINFHWKNLSNQLDPSKYQRLVFGVILILMMNLQARGHTSRGPTASASSKPIPREGGPIMSEAALISRPRVS